MANINEKLAVMNVLKDWAGDTNTAFSAVETEINNINIADNSAALAVQQSPAGAGDLTLVGSDPAVPRKVTLSSPDDCSSVTFDVIGTDENGDAHTEANVTGPTAGATVEAGDDVYFSTITQISVSAACDNISAGIGEVHSDPIYAALQNAKSFKSSGVQSVDLSNSVASITAEATA